MLGLAHQQLKFTLKIRGRCPFICVVVVWLYSHPTPHPFNDRWHIQCFTIGIDNGILQQMCIAAYHWLTWTWTAGFACHNNLVTVFCEIYWTLIQSCYIATSNTLASQLINSTWKSMTVLHCVIKLLAFYVVIIPLPGNLTMEEIECSIIYNPKQLILTMIRSGEVKTYH